MANNWSPKLRSDVTITLHQTSTGVSYIIKDPLTGKFFRCGETEKFIAEQCDGTTPPEVIVERTEKKYNASLSLEMLRSFLNALESNNLLETGEEKRITSDRRGKRITGTLLYLRLKAFDPDAFFTTLGPYVGIFFTKQFLWISAGAILLAAMILAGYWSEFSRDLDRLYQFSSIPLFMLVVFVVIGLHECAHGLTCKHFGGEVHEMGIMLLYFQPALYCNVSDAWLLREKSKRLWVSFAGPYFEIFLWSLATITWRITSPETWINHLALIVVTSSGIKTLLNFNPFIKLDGYYLLSDWLGIPNLRKKAFMYVGNQIKKVFGFEYPADIPVARRERRIYLLYGSLASIGSFTLLAYVLVTMGEYLIDHRQPVAFMVASGLIGIRFRKKFRRLFGGSSAGEDDEEYETAETNNGSVTNGTHKKSKAKESTAFKRRLFWGVIGVCTILILFLVPVDLGISGPFTILPIHNADVRSQIDGIIEKIYVAEGDVVRAGDLIARFSGREHTMEFQKVTEQIRQARAKLRMMENGPTKEMIALAQTDVEKAREHVKYAHSRLERNRAMFEKDLISQREFEDTQELAAIAEKDLASAKGKLDVLMIGARPEEIEAAKAEIAALQTQQRYLQGQLERIELRSPVDGIVATPARQLKEMLHQSVQKGMLVAKIYDFKKLMVEIALPEKEIADVQVGYDVALKAQAYPNKTFAGSVVSIAASATPSQPGSANSSASPGTGKTILVTTVIDNSELLLKPEMTGQAKIYCGKRTISEILTRKIIRTIKIDFWSWW